MEACYLGTSVYLYMGVKRVVTAIQTMPSKCEVALGTPQCYEPSFSP